MEKIEELQQALDRNFFAKEHSVRNYVLEPEEFIKYLVARDAHDLKEEKEITRYAKTCLRDIEIRQLILVDKKVFDETFAEDKRLFEDFARKFATYRAEFEVPVDVWLKKHAKTLEELIQRADMYQKSEFLIDPSPMCGEWVSVPEISARLMKLVQERDDNKLLVIQAVTKLRAKEEQLEDKVLVDRKQLSEHVMIEGKIRCNGHFCDCDGMTFSEFLRMLLVKGSRSDKLSQEVCKARNCRLCLDRFKEPMFWSCPLGKKREVK